MKTAEQLARDMLERAGVEGAQNWTTGDLVEIANLIARDQAHTSIVGDRVMRACPVCDLPRESVLPFDKQPVCNHSMQEIRDAILAWDQRHMIRRIAQALESIAENMR
jgi:hypothetical protein